MSKPRPWSPESRVPIGESDPGPIYLSKEDCEGCGHPSVLGFVKQFPLDGYQEFAVSCPTPRFFRRAEGSLAFNRTETTSGMHPRPDPQDQYENPPYPCGLNFSGETEGSGQANVQYLGASDEVCFGKIVGGTKCPGLPEGQLPGSCDDYAGCTGTQIRTTTNRSYGYDFEVTEDGGGIWVPLEPSVNIFSECGKYEL